MAANPAKACFQRKKKTFNPDLPAGSISFGKVVFKNEDSLAPETKASYQEVLPGEFLVNPLNMNFDLMSLRTALSSIAVVVSTGYLVMKSVDGYDKQYLRWLLQQFDVAHMKTLGAGVRQTIGFTDIGNSFIFEPPLPEQTQIAAFLDHETAKIDALIAKQERLIALLEEKRQAVISHAVTKGLNPDAPLRPSGIDWLGDVPAHWEVKRGKHLFEFVTSGSRGWAEHYTDEGALFFRITNLTRNTIRPKMLSLQYVSPPKGAEGERSKIAQGDLLISITADLGSICVADERLEGGYVSQHVALCRPSAEVSSSDWLGYAVLSDASKLQLLGSGYGGTKIQLSLPDLRELLLAKPPLSEQLEIAKFLDKKLESFAQILDRGEEQITLLKERRTALISAAVTGKIDVRDWQPSKDISDQDTTQKAFA